MDYRLTTEDLNWLRKLTMLGCAQVKGRGEYSITLRGRDELVDRELETQIG